MFQQNQGGGMEVRRWIRDAYPYIYNQGVQTGMWAAGYENLVANQIEGNMDMLVNTVRQQYGNQVNDQVLGQLVADAIRYFIQNSPQMQQPVIFGQQPVQMRGAGFAPRGRMMNPPITPTYQQQQPQQTMFQQAPPMQFQQPLVQQPIVKQPTPSAPIPTPKKVATPQPKQAFEATQIDAFDDTPTIGSASAKMTAFDDGRGRAVLVTYDYERLGNFASPEAAIYAARQLTKASPQLRVDIVKYNQLIVMPYAYVHVNARLQSLQKDIQTSGTGDDRYGYYNLILENLKHGEEPGVCELFKKIMTNRFNKFCNTGSFTTPAETEFLSIDEFENVIELKQPSDDEAVRAFQSLENFDQKLMQVCRWSFGDFISNVKILHPSIRKDMATIIQTLGIYGTKELRVDNYFLYEAGAMGQIESLSDEDKASMLSQMSKTKELLGNVTVLAYPALAIGSTVVVDDNVDMSIIQKPTNVLDYILCHPDLTNLEDLGIADLVYNNATATVRTVVTKDLRGNTVVNNRALLEK